MKVIEMKSLIENNLFTCLLKKKSKQIKNKRTTKSEKIKGYYWKTELWKVSCERKNEIREKDNRDEKRAFMIAPSFYIAYKYFSGRTNCVVYP